MHLPSLPQTPTRHPSSCATLSHALLTTLTTLLPSVPNPPLLLSIGSGTGLLEALLQTRIPHWRIEGVEVHASINIYLPPDRFVRVAGTWAVCARARDADALLFVYPRSGELVRRYVEEMMGEGTRVRVVVLWIGPKADWEDTGFGKIRVSEGYEVVEMRDGVGLAEYEMLAVLRAKTT